MTRLFWDADYDSGLDRGVFYAQGAPGEVWNGLISVKESPSDVGNRTGYRDGIKVANRSSEGSYSATIEAYTYPPSFLQHPRQSFGLSWRVMSDEGYKIHVVYNALAHMTDRSYGQGEHTPFSFDITTKPVAVPNAKPSAHLIIDSKVAAPIALLEFEDLLYGNNSIDASLPSPRTIFDIFEMNALVQVFDNGDGTFTITGPDSVIKMLDGTTFQIAYPSAIYVDEESYTVTTY